MIENQDEVASGSRRFEDEPPTSQGVVVSLATHRLWRTKNYCPCPDFDPAFKLPEWDCEVDWLEGGGDDKKPAAGRGPEPCLWLVLLAGFLTFVSIIGFYWAFIAGVKALASLTFLWF